MDEIEREQTKVYEYLLDEQRGCLATILACADTVNESQDSSVADGPADALYEELVRTDVLEQLPTVLADTVSVLETPLATRPVPAPPYIVVTNVGPIMRATIGDRRLVVTIEAFRIEKKGTYRYARTTNNPADVLTVEIHE